MSFITGLQEIQLHLYNDEDDRIFFGWIQSLLHSQEKRQEAGRAALQHLEMHLINVACDDPGASIANKLVLPMLCERLAARANEFNESLNVRMEVCPLPMLLMLHPACQSLISRSTFQPSLALSHARQSILGVPSGTAKLI